MANKQTKRQTNSSQYKKGTEDNILYNEWLVGNILLHIFSVLQAERQRIH